jgi:hypothetical protein
VTELPAKLLQAEFDIPKFVEQRRLLDETKLSKEERNGVGRLLLKSILIRIGSMRECVESQSTMATVFGVQRETINTAISRLTALDLITKERFWNERYCRVLNHYRVNWTELARRLKPTAKGQDQCEDLPGTDVRIHQDQCEDSQRTDVRIQQDQCEDSPRTDVRIHGDRNRETKSIGITTTESEWDPVVVSLSKIGVSQIPQAIAKAKARGDSPADVQRIITHTLSDQKHAGKDMRGIVYNQVCSPSKVTIRKLGAKPDREVIFERLHKEWLASGIARSAINHQELHQRTDQIYKAALARWNGSAIPS